MKTLIVRTAALAALTLLAATCQAAPDAFTLDAQGSKPRGYVLAVPESTGKPLAVAVCTTSRLGGRKTLEGAPPLIPGVQGGKLVLSADVDGARSVVGYVDDLEHCFLLPGVALRGYQGPNWQGGPPTWQHKLYVDAGLRLESFTGEDLGVAQAVARLVANARAGGSLEPSGNVKVLQSTFAALAFEHLDSTYIIMIERGQRAAELDQAYLTQMKAAAQELQGAPRQRLADVNRAAIHAFEQRKALLLEELARIHVVVSYHWEKPYGPEYDWIMAELMGLQQALTGRP